MSDEWPSQAWIDALVASGGDESSERTSVSATVNFVVTGAPGGEGRYFLELQDGRVVRVERGSLPEADVTFTLTFADAEQMQGGKLNLSAAFMQGRMKFSGDMAKLMSPEAPLLPSIDAITARAAA